MKRDRQPPSWIGWHPLVIVLVTVAGVAWFLYAERRVAGTWGYSLDDSWIYADYARNVASGRGYAFNPGERVAGATGPLYVFILALLYWVFHEVVLPAKVWGTLCLAASGIVVWRTVLRIDPKRPAAALLAGALVAGSPPLLWGSVSGLEITTYLLVACLGMAFYVADRWTWAVAFWSLGVWLRPDGLLLALLGLVLRPRITLKNTVVPAIIAVTLVASYFAFNLTVGDSILPNSVRVSAQPGGNLLGREWTMVKQGADLWLGSVGALLVGYHAVLLLPAVVVGGFLMFRRWPALPGYFVLFPLSLATYRPWGGQVSRYLVYTVPFGIVLGVTGWVFAARRLGRHASVGLWIVGLVCLGWQGYAAEKLGRWHGWNVQNIEGMQHYIAEAAREHTSPGDTIAVNDVGAIGYFSDCYVLDLVGLVSPRLSFPEYLRRYRPKYMVIFPDWFQHFASLDRSTQQYVFYDADSVLKYSPFLVVRLHNNSICARDKMYLYQRMGRYDSGPRRIPVIVH